MNMIVVAAALYLAKVILISALLFGYYRLFLRDRLFHQYNRYYLLGATLASLVLPLIPMPLPGIIPVIGRSPVVGPALHAIVAGSWQDADVVPGSGNAAQGQWSGALLLTMLYATDRKSVG